jgi:hypothetical protein
MSHPTKARRSPRGVVTEKPIPIRLLPAERAEVMAGAEREARSTAAFSRLLLLRGLADYRQQNQHAPANA